ncbi:hypothetical protein ABZW30_00310 [Kitasatospora sp. NPDC004669]|uniref:hypothetical protein n=1 Tax=Kitasatospora sp. NPDC004669 TaxID=3154555 RepID=UPI0033A6361C
MNRDPVPAVPTAEPERTVPAVRVVPVQLPGQVQPIPADLPPLLALPYAPDQPAARQQAEVHRAVEGDLRQIEPLPAVPRNGHQTGAAGRLRSRTGRQ